MSIIKKIKISVIFLGLTLVGYSQSNIRLNDFVENTYNINPASIKFDYFAEFSIASRKQWMSLPGSPLTFFAYGTAYIESKKTQLGIKLLQDKIGFTSNTDIDISYAYSVKLDRRWRLNLGLAGSYQMTTYDLSKLFPTVSDPTVSSLLVDENNFNADFGLEFTSKSLRFGASSQNILSLFDENQFSNTNYIYAMYRQNRDELINLGVGICGINYGDFLQAELNLTSYINLSKDNDLLRLGLFYRTLSEMGVVMGVDLSNLMSITYSYDFSLGGVTKNSIGTHELVLSYKLNKIFKCRNCPD